ncbi:HPF/RaiA family ribosome-associated protein [Amycolatopsis sp. NPDC051045]|uniref:HPF/RaiA family ribosome-associated protein n=1 Tax=Amycolatopsis sp. NPDC051045 TaxID=3156922 RepID=UPI0034142FCC
MVTPPNRWTSAANRTGLRREQRVQIQISTDKNVHGSDELIQRIEAELQSTLSRLSGHITRLEVHLSDEVATGGGSVDRRCVMEARPEGRPAVAVTHHAGSVDEACHGAVRKLESLLESKYGRADHRKGGESIRHMTEDSPR